MFLNTSSDSGGRSAGACAPVTPTHTIQSAVVAAIASLMSTPSSRPSYLRVLRALEIELRAEAKLAPIQNLRHIFPRRAVGRIHRQHRRRVEQIVDVEARAQPTRAAEAERAREAQIELLRARLEQ